MAEENTALDIIKDVSKDLAKEVYRDIQDPIVKPTTETVGIIPRAIKAALLNVEKWVLDREYNLAATKKLLEEKLQNTPHELIQPPPLYIAAPAIENLGYCMDNEELRDMYANLLASSMNTVVKNGVHPAFVDIIKQLSPDEAKILKYFKIHEIIPSITVRGNDKRGAGIIYVKNFSNIGEMVGCEQPYHIPEYFDNLIRLGLIEKAGSFVALTDKKLYEPLKNHPQILRTIEKIKSRKDECCNPGFEESHMSITSFGRRFCEICLSITNFVVTVKKA